MPQSNVEAIKSRLDIVELVKEYIQLKPAGSYHKANCPFHNEKTPSFMVSHERQMYHCFGCGEHGDIFSFVQKMEGIEFPEALRLLAQKAGVELKTDDPRARNERTKLQDILRYATRVYQEYVKKLPSTHAVQQYIEERRLTQETIDAFQIGFAPDAWDTLSVLFAKKNIRPQDAQAAGLLVRKDDGSGFYDRFRARLMFPIADTHGNIIGFGGRVIPKLEAKCLGKEAAKYINTPQSDVYNKSNVLYGMHLAKNAIRKEKQVIVVEGYMDCIAAHQAGTENTVASSGTAFTEGQAKLIKRFTSNVLVAYDMDEAGVAAVARGVAVLLQEGITVRVVELQGAKDPDDMIRKDPSAWKKAIAQPKLFLDFAFDQTIKGKDLSDVQAKKNVAAELLPLIASIGNPIEQSHYIQKLAALVNVEEMVIRQSLKPKQKNKYATKSEKSFSAEKQHPFLDLLSILMRKPDFFSEVTGQLSQDALAGSGFEELYSILSIQYNQTHHIDFKAVREQLTQSDTSAKLIQMLDIAELGSARLPEHTDQVGRKTVQRIMQDHLREQLHRISNSIAKAEAANNKIELQTLAKEFEHIMQELRHFTSHQ